MSGWWYVLIFAGLWIAASFLLAGVFIATAEDEPELDEREAATNGRPSGNVTVLRGGR